MQEEANKEHGKLESLIFYIKQENEENSGRKG